MSTRPACPPNMPWMIPSLTVPDPAQAQEYYAKTFGFRKGMMIPGQPGQPSMYGDIHWHDLQIMLMPPCPQTPGAPQPPSVSGQACPTGLYLYVEDVDAAHAQALANSCQELMAPALQFWGDKMSCVRDAYGYVWSLATNVADFDPSKVPQG